MAGRFDDVEIAVIGGGVVGMSLAYGLTLLGKSVMVLDEGDIAHRASRGNFALVWVQGKGIAMPEYALWSLRSAEMWTDFAAELEAASGLDLAYSQRGGLVPALSEAELESRIEGLMHLHNLAPQSAKVERLDHARMKAVLPGIGPEVVGGTFCLADGHVNSLRLFNALHGVAIAAGTRYRPNETVDTIAPLADGFAITTEQGEVRARRLVLAAGLGNARLGPMVGLDAPVYPQRGQIMVTEKLAPFLDYPLMTIRQTDEGGVMIGDSKEDVGFDNGNHHGVLANTAARAIRILPALADAQVVRSWGALRVMSPDGHPIYDRSIDHPGAYLVTCHSGITLAAVHARVIAKAIADDHWDEAFDVFSARRFGHVPAAA